MRFLRIVGAVVLLAAVAVQPASASAVVSKSENVKPISHIKYWGGSHLTFGGDYAYAAQWNGRGERPKVGGIHIIDISGQPREVGFFKCAGADTDVAFVEPGVVAVGHHDAACNPLEPGKGEDDSGLYTIDVSDPRRPEMMGSLNLPRDVEGQDRSGRQNHSISKYPGKPIIYTNSGGLPSNGQMLTHVIDVSNPNKPKVMADFRADFPSTGCHDFSFHFDKRGKFGFCSGLGGTSIWDVSNPAKPEVISHIVNPLIQFSHYSVASADGKILAINDENITANDCVEQETPTGAVWFYDISDVENPEFISYHSPRRGGGPVGSFEAPWGTCTSHDFNWADNRRVVVPWYSGGFSVIDVKDPSAPKEIAHYQAEGGSMWSAHYYKGRIYTNDQLRGFEAFEVKGL